MRSLRQPKDVLPHANKSLHRNGQRRFGKHGGNASGDIGPYNDQTSPPQLPESEDMISAVETFLKQELD
jgi:hypothetical protein